MKVYLDVSCLNRPFDDQRQPRVRLEAEAVAIVFEALDAGRWRQVSSQIAEIEIAAMLDAERRSRVRALLPSREDIMELTPEIFRRAAVLEQSGFKPADALHVAAAEAQKADVLLSCDDRLCRLAMRRRGQLSVLVANPITWLEEVDNASNA